MQKKLKRSFTLIILIVLTFFIFMNTQTVKANTNDETNKIEEIILDEEIEIEVYDARTNTTRDVDMDEIRDLLGSKNSSTNGISTTAGYKPFKSVNRYTTPTLTANSSTAQPVNSTSSFPYKSTCRIKAYDSEGKAHYATAALVGKKLALTSAHCVFDQAHGNYVYRNWTVEPGYNNGSNPSKKSTGWDQVYYPKEWLETHDSGLDWAICVLQADLGTEAGYFEARSYDFPIGLVGRKVTVLGYPAEESYGFEKDAPDQYKTTGEIQIATDKLFAGTYLSYGGFSGGPVFESDNYIVGVNHGRVDTLSYAAKVNSEIIDLINSLR